ncbi:hypothetical protein CHS0354_023913 [Potamilus streckersoni]|uniref:Beta-lactamase-related domain-containing protein n=1 Tax=Potamilus streckersoni TaxID=2493646 RepID=A0AAE0RZC0_9BIVA|nr:hypothetical protein CHS0354_023913 [Potamilus streckersoni]
MTLFDETLVAFPGERTIYSDLNFLLLQEIVIRVSKKTPFGNVSFYDYYKENFITPLKLTQTLFAPDSSFISRIAPTDSLFQEKINARKPLVHDPTAAIAKGIAGNAGLFSNATQIASLASIFLENGSTQSIRFLMPKTISIFTKKITDRTLGLDTKTSSSSMCGKYFSYSTYGHLGFTGTSFWIDPERKLLVVLLTNRVFPNQTNKLIAKFRPLIHDAIVRAIDPFAKPLN